MSPAQDDDSVETSASDLGGEWSRYSRLVMETLKRLETGQRQLLRMLTGDGTPGGPGLFTQIALIEKEMRDGLEDIGKRIGGLHAKYEKIEKRVAKIEAGDREVRREKVTRVGVVIAAVVSAAAALVALFFK